MEEGLMKHSDERVRDAITKLLDALCEYERNTGVRSVFILRESDGGVYRAIDGKPNVPNDIPDAALLDQLR